MANLNQCNFIGNCGKDPEVRTIQNGDKVASFSIACTEKYTDKAGNKQEKTEWVNLVVWGGLADVVERYIRKGSQVYVSGKMSTRSWEDKDTGKKVYKTEVVVKELVMLGGGGKKEDETPLWTPPQQQDAFSGSAGGDDSLPF